MSLVAKIFRNQISGDISNFYQLIHLLSCFNFLTLYFFEHINSLHCGYDENSCRKWGMYFIQQMCDFSLICVYFVFFVLPFVFESFSYFVYRFSYWNHSMHNHTAYAISLLTERTVQFVSHWHLTRSNTPIRRMTLVYDTSREWQLLLLKLLGLDEQPLSGWIMARFSSF